VHHDPKLLTQSAVDAATKRRETPVTREEIDAIALRDVEKAILLFEKHQEASSDRQEFRIYVVITTDKDRKESGLLLSDLPLVQPHSIKDSEGDGEGVDNTLETWIFIERMPLPVVDERGETRVEVRRWIREDPTIKSVAWVK